MENNKSSMGLKVALGIALVLFLGTAFYTMNLYQSSAKVQKDLTEQKQLVMNDLNAMAKQYDVAISENEVANKDLVEAIAGMAPYFPSPKTLLIASSSTESPTGVLVPCVLI